jgi:hypothetical protein
MTTPSPELAAYMTLVRRRLIRTARDQSWTLAYLNSVLTELSLATYRTANLIGSAVIGIQLDPADPTPRPSATETRQRIRVVVTNSPINNAQVSEWKGFEFVSFNTTTQVLRMQVFLVVARTSGTLADAEAACRAAVAVAKYSPLVEFPNITGQSILSFAWDTPDADDPT